MYVESVMTGDNLIMMIMIVAILNRYRDHDMVADILSVLYQSETSASDWVLPPRLLCLSFASFLLCPGLVLS